jgi:hypothetical protein
MATTAQIIANRKPLRGVSRLPLRAFTNQRENKLVVLSINQKDYVLANSLLILPRETPNSELKYAKQTQISASKMNIKSAITKDYNYEPSQHRANTNPPSIIHARYASRFTRYETVPCPPSSVFCLPTPNGACPEQQSRETTNSKTETQWSPERSRRIWHTNKNHQSPPTNLPVNKVQLFPIFYEIGRHCTAPFTAFCKFFESFAIYCEFPPKTPFSTQSRLTNSPAQLPHSPYFQPISHSPIPLFSAFPPFFQRIS